MVINQETKEFWDKEIINANLIWQMNILLDL